MQLLRNSFIYSISILFQGGVVFFLLPLYTLYLSPTQYGIIAVLSSLTGFLAMFYLLSLHGAATRFYFDHTEDKKKNAELFSTIFFFILAFGSLLTGLFFFFHDFLLDPFLKGIDFYPYTLLTLITVFLSSFYLLYQAILQARQKAGKYGIVNFIYVLTNSLLIVAFIVFSELKVTGVLLAPLITNFIFLIFIFFDLFLKEKISFNFQILKECLKYAIPLLPHTLFTWAMLTINKVLLNNLDSTATAGIYDIGFIFANLINILAWAINQAYVPWFFDKMKEKANTSSQIVKFACDATIFYGFCGFLLALFSKEILPIFVTDAFNSATLIVPILAFAYVFNGLYYFFVNPLFYNKKTTKYVSLCTIVSAIINVALNLILIPEFGIIGSAIGTLVALFFSSVLALLISHKVEHLPFKWQKMYAYTFLFLGLSSVVFLDKYFVPSTFLLLKIFLAILIGILLYLKHKTEINWFFKSILRHEHY